MSNKCRYSWEELAKRHPRAAKKRRVMKKWRNQRKTFDDILKLFMRKALGEFYTPSNNMTADEASRFFYNPWFAEQAALRRVISGE